MEELPTADCDSARWNRIVYQGYRSYCIKKQPKAAKKQVCHENALPPTPSDKLKLTVLILQRSIFLMSSELLNAALFPFGLIFVGWALGTLLLKIQGAEE